MKAHKLDRRIDLYSATTTTNNVGEQVPSWSKTATVAAQIRYSATREDYTNGVEYNSQTVAFLIRYRPSLSRKQRISFNGATYDIEGIKEIKRKELIEIEAVEVES